MSKYKYKHLKTFIFNNVWKRLIANNYKFCITLFNNMVLFNERGIAFEPRSNVQI